MDKEVLARWDIEVEQEANSLVERGVPPWEAIEKAVKIVSRRRGNKFPSKQISRPPCRLEPGRQSKAV